MLLLKVLWAFISVGILGALLGFGLAIASKFFSVKKDKRISQVEEALPGLNCGSCGFAGCEPYAEAIVEQSEVLDLCRPGGQDTANALADIMGVESIEAGARMVAQVHCRGGEGTATYKFAYEGLRDCNAAFQLYGGAKECPHGCLALGSCIKVCPVDAIHYNKSGLVLVERKTCISCGKCIDVCPTGVMQFVPHDADRIVACNSTDKGGVVRKYCTVGCIGCKRCDKSSPEGGFVIDTFLATIDYDKKGDRSAAEEKCPTHCIVQVDPIQVDPVEPVQNSTVVVEPQTAGVAQAQDETD